MGGGVEGPPVRVPAGPRFPSLPAATPPLQGRGLRPVRRWSKGGGGGGDYVWSIPWCPSLCPVCGRPRGTAGGGAQAWAGRVRSGGRPRRRRHHAGAGPVAVAGRCGRTGRRPAVALRAPLHGVGGRAGGTRAAQAWPWGARVQGRRRARCGPHCGPRDQRLAGSVALGDERVRSGGRPRRWRRHAGAGPVAAAGRRTRTGWWSAAALRAPLHGVGVHVGGGGGGCGLAGGCAREGDGGAVSSAAERHRAADRAEERPGVAKVGRGARGARGVGGAAVGGGAHTPLSEGESRRASSTGANPGGGGGERHAVPSRSNRTGTGPAGGIPGVGRGWAPGLRGPGPWWLWAGAGETGRASRLRLVRGGVEGLGGLRGEPRGLGQGSRGRPFLEGGGGGVAPCPGCAGAPCGAVQGRGRVGRRRGAAVWGRARVQRAAARAAAWGRGGARRGAAYGRGMGPRRCAARGRAGVQRVAAQGRSAGPRMGAAWGCAGAQ